MFVFLFSYIYSLSQKESFTSSNKLFGVGGSWHTYISHNEDMVAKKFWLVLEQ